MNPLYQQMNSNDLVSRFRQFQRMFRGDPQRQVQELLNSGKVSQAQYDQAVRQAQNLKQMLGM